MRRRAAKGDRFASFELALERRVLSAKQILCRLHARPSSLLVQTAEGCVREQRIWARALNADELS